MGREKSSETGRRHGLPALLLLGSRESRAGQEDMGVKREKWAIGIMGTSEGKHSIFSSLPLGRRMSNQHSQTLVCVRITGDPPETRSDSAVLGWGLVLCISCLFV